MSTPNVELLKRTLAHIEEHPEEWNQEKWRCGTTACFAGHAALLSGADWRDKYEDDMSVIGPDGEWDLVYYYAQKVLGLENRDYVCPHNGDDEHGIELFDACNDLDDLRRIVTELCAEAEQVTP